MKKFVKPLIVASAVAAVAGIGAVSFAAWTSGTTTNNVTGGGTGFVSTSGFVSGSTSSLTDKLLPYNQGSPSSGETLYYDILLKVAGNDLGDYKIQGSYTGTLTGKLYYKVDQTESVTYSGSGWDELTTSAADLNGGDELEAGDWYVHIALDSSDPGDMNQSLSFSFELVAA